VISDLAPLVFDGLDSVELVPGAYIVTYNEIVHLPNNIMALATPRSSLLRCGVTVNTAVWDAGYSGRSQSLMVVYNPRGFRLQRNARIVQLVFFQMTGETEGYRGAYQGENI
jgi:dUTP pyrophosphatase